MAYQQQVPGATRRPDSCSARERRNAAALAFRNLSPYGIDSELTGSLLVLIVTPISLTADYNLTGEEGLALVTPDALGPWTVYLPDADTMVEGTVVYFKNASSVNSFDVDVVSSGTIDGVSGGTTMTALTTAMVVAATASGAGSREWFWQESP